jgi:hypothetical protein
MKSSALLGEESQESIKDKGGGSIESLPVGWNLFDTVHGGSRENHDALYPNP